MLAARSSLWSGELSYRHRSDLRLNGGFSDTERDAILKGMAEAFFVRVEGSRSASTGGRTSSKFGSSRLMIRPTL